MKTIGARIRELRQSYNVTQKQLADAVGVEQSTIGKYEGNSKVTPSDEIKIKIADYFDVSVDYLLGREAQGVMELKPVERDLVKSFRNLNRQGQDYIMQTMMMAVQTYSNNKSGHDTNLENQEIIKEA